MKKNYKLSNGVLIPDICFGGGIVHTYRHVDESLLRYFKYKMYTQIKDRKQYYLDSNFYKTVQLAMDNGLNMFDTSSAYGDAEHALGIALKKYKREDYFVVTKLCNKDQYNGSIRAAFESSLQALNLEYIDLYMIHWPITDIWIDSWKQIEDIYREGLCRAIGVCNCNIHHLQELQNDAKVMPMVNEIECHPLFTQDDLRCYCDEMNIKVMAYTSTARMDERLRKTVLVSIGKKYNKTITQIILKWHQQIGTIPIFNSSKPDHVLQNIDIDDFDLTDEEVNQITSININSRLRYDSDNCDFTQL